MSHRKRNKKSTYAPGKRKHLIVYENENKVSPKANWLLLVKYWFTTLFKRKREVFEWFTNMISKGSFLVSSKHFDNPIFVLKYVFHSILTRRSPAWKLEVIENNTYNSMLFMGGFLFIYFIILDVPMTSYWHSQFTLPHYWHFSCITAQSSSVDLKRIDYLLTMVVAGFEPGTL